MRKLVSLFAAAAVAAGVMTAPLTAARPSGEERLSKLIEGRVAGTPKSCIYTPGNRSLTVIDKTAIVYKEGKRVWVNRTAHPEDIDEDDILVIRKFGSSNLCRTDLITLADRNSGMFSGTIFLGDFVPYEKAS